MAGMKRFVTYIYSYEDKKKGNNTGFAKVEIRGEECRIEIHLRGVYAGHKNCKVYLFRENAAEMEGVLIGEMNIRNGVGDFATAMRASKIKESELGFFQMEGIFLLGEDDSIFMSRWKEGGSVPAAKENFREWKSQPIPQQPVQPQKPVGVTRPAQQVRQPQAVRPTRAVRPVPSRQPVRSVHQEQQEEPKEPVQPKPEVQPDAAVQKNDSETASQDSVKDNSVEPKAISTPTDFDEENVKATEVPMRNLFPKYRWEDIWKALTESRETVKPFQDQNVSLIKVELKDLKELPKKYWYLGNNSFLLHGFFNYHYLVIGKIEDSENTGETRWFIGVPGIYQNQERVMAAIFGFPEFLPEAKENYFGYWYRYIEE